MKIYTKTGDDGTTGLYSGKRVSKTSSVIKAYGSVDELNSWIGFVAVENQDGDLNEALLKIQNDLHILCSDLATPLDAKKSVPRVNPEQTKTLEKWIDQWDAETEPLKNFILQRGSELACRFHMARTISRKAEREVLAHEGSEQSNHEVAIYLNRLSDLLFVFARVANKRAVSAAEKKQEPKKQIPIAQR